MILCEVLCGFCGLRRTASSAAGRTGSRLPTSQTKARGVRGRKGHSRLEAKSWSPSFAVRNAIHSIARHVLALSMMNRLRSGARNKRD